MRIDIFRKFPKFLNMNDAYKAMAHPVRREILNRLRDRAHTAGELADLFNLTKPTLSGHFAVLREAGLIDSEKLGASVIYRINMSVAEEALSGLMELLRVGDPAPAPFHRKEGKPS